jgi:hypothetical protein
MWRLNALRIVYQAGLDIAKRVGSNENVVKLFGSVVFTTKDLGPNAGETFFNHIQLNSVPGKFTSWSVAHELGHVMDDNAGDQYSIKLENDTGGYTVGGIFRKRGCNGIEPGCNDAGYYYGDKPTMGSDKNFDRYEDFAESFAGSVYPDKVKEYKDKLEVNSSRYSLFYFSDYGLTSRGIWMRDFISNKLH